MTDVRKKINSFADACILAGEDSNDKKFQEGESDEIAYRQLKVIARAYNGDEKPDWDNPKQYKYFPWFYLNKPGFRLFGIVCGWTAAITGAGSRLCFLDEDNARDAVEKFLDIFKAFIV